MQPTSWSKDDPFPPGFENDDRLRSAFIRELTLNQLRGVHASSAAEGEEEAPSIPRTLIRYWHDHSAVPQDVRDCLGTWEVLRDAGFAFRMFDDITAGRYIAERYGEREVAAFARCRHPAMRSDYLRLCFVLADGGLYVDADDVLLRGECEAVVRGHSLKVQPLCYDLTTHTMVPAADLRRTDLATHGRIFYVNNNPIAAPAGHPVLRRALARATDRLLGDDPEPEIQSTTGPGNLTAVLAAYAREQQVLGSSSMLDFELLLEWESIAEPRWDLAYRNDERNWRNMSRG